MAEEEELPHWERGHRCHGYWIGTTRFGVVSYGPGRRAASAAGYNWSFDCPKEGALTGYAIRLATAKRKVEKAYASRKRTGLPMTVPAKVPMLK